MHSIIRAKTYLLSIVRLCLKYEESLYLKKFLGAKTMTTLLLNIELASIGLRRKLGANYIPVSFVFTFASVIQFHYVPPKNKKYINSLDILT